MRTILYISFLIIFSTTSFSFSGKGSGAEDDPYQITNITELQNIKTDTDSKDKYFKLMNDIDASETRYWNVGNHDGDTSTPDEPTGFKPINRFFGSFDGDGHVIKNLFINIPYGINYIGLFGYISSYGVIKKLGIENCEITGSGWVGSICGLLEIPATIEECYTNGKIKSIDSILSGPIGGFCGYNNFAEIINCYSSCSVSIISTKYNNSVASFCSSYSPHGNIYQNCYTIGKLISKKEKFAFGEYEKGFQCFWDVETTGIPDTGGHQAKGLPTSEMMKKATYVNAGWDFDSIWCIDEGRDYPKLRAFGKCPPTDVPLEPKDNGNKIEIKPNPAYSSIDVVYILKEAGTAQIIITNSFGQQVYIENINNINPEQEQRHSIDICTFPSGLYFVTLRSHAVALTKGVVVIK